MSPQHKPYSDTGEIMEESLRLLAELRGTWLGDHLVAIALLADLIDKTDEMLVERVALARTHDHGWQDIAEALGTTSAEVRMRFDGRSPLARSWLL